MKKGQIDIDFDNSLGPWLGKTVKIVDYHLQAEFAVEGLDITKEQMIVLKKLFERDGMNQNELAEQTYRDKSSLTRMLTTMERKGYIKRVRCREDKRVNFVYLTKTGITMWKKAKPLAERIIKRMRADLKPEEVQQLIASLKKIQGSLIHSGLTPA